MQDAILEQNATRLAGKVKHYLITTIGKRLAEASDTEFYKAFCLTLREEIMINWTACEQTWKREKPRTLYYICMEYLPGRFLGNNISNMHAQKLVRLAIEKLGRKPETIEEQEPEPGLGNGGLGRLAACMLDALATKHYPAIGYGLRYQYGIFEQQLWAGLQIEKPDTWLRLPNPWEFRPDNGLILVKFGQQQEEVRAVACDYPIIGYSDTPHYSVAKLRLWTTKESPRNFQLQRYNAGRQDLAAENSSLTDVLYPSDNNEFGKRVRLKQEFLLVSASLQDIVTNHIALFGNMDLFADKVRIQLNDTHPALAIAELMRLLTQEQGFSWDKAFAITRTCCSFTNHTVLKESLEEWNIDRFKEQLPIHYPLIEKLDSQLAQEVAALGKPELVDATRIIKNGQIRMAYLAFYGSSKINGVAQLHTEILKTSVFKELHTCFPSKIINITNGVTQRRWLLQSNPELADWITGKIGSGWITDFAQIEKLLPFAKDPTPQQEFLKIKEVNKKRLLAHLKTNNPLRSATGTPIGTYNYLGTDALFDIQIKRIHEYKRQLMNALHTLLIYQQISSIKNCERIKRMVLIGGKAAPSYAMAKNILILISVISRKIQKDEKARDRLQLIFVENYCVSLAEKLIPAADLSQQISTAGLEASGTGNMKLTMNGALTIGTDDGANVEMRKSVTDAYWPFLFGAPSEENDKVRKKTTPYHPRQILEEHPYIAKLLNSLIDGSLTENEAEINALNAIHWDLLNSNNPDPFLTLRDFHSYCETQKQVEAFYKNREKWAEYAIANIAKMGPFSIDTSVDNYVKNTWQLTPCPVDPDDLTGVRAEYAEHDQCRINLDPE